MTLPCVYECSSPSLPVCGHVWRQEVIHVVYIQCEKFKPGKLCLCLCLSVYLCLCLSVSVSVAVFGIRQSFVLCTYTADSWTSSSLARCATLCGVWRSSALKLMWSCCSRCCRPHPPGQRSAHHTRTYTCTLQNNHTLTATCTLHNNHTLPATCDCTVQIDHTVASCTCTCTSTVQTESPK